MKIRNVAIIAHVDHGKTTLVDALLKQSGTFRANQTVSERAMDSNDLEKEKGITILSKCTSVSWNGYKINIIDTPGHADFGGEVERILGMVEGVILLVDSQEGPMPQTRFVTSKALSLGLKPIVLINKMDKAERRPKEVHEEVLELFMNLNATDEQLDFPILYAAAREGWVSKEEDKVATDVAALFETIIDKIKPPKDDQNLPFSLVTTMLENDSYVGRMMTGKIQSGSVKVGDNLKALDIYNNVIEKSKVTKLMIYEGLSKKVVEEAFCGDIVCIAGFSKATVSNTVCALEVEQALIAKPIDPPVLSMTFSINDSPLCGREGTKLTSRMIRDRLLKEQETNVSIRVDEIIIEGNKVTDTFKVSGRGELQIAIIIETMRREGFELSIGRPEVVTYIGHPTDPARKDDGKKYEPVEFVQIEVDEAFAGTVIQTITSRRGRLEEMQSISADNKQKIIFLAPTRGLIGYYSNFLTDTKGTGTMSRVFHDYEEVKGAIPHRINGVLISTATGKSVAYGLFHLEDSGTLFIGPGEDVYVGMIIGEHTRPNDLEVNPLKSKQLTNMRASGKDDAVALTPFKRMTLETAISYIQDGEIIEVTPKHIRLRKQELNSTDRKRQERSRASL
ncbi:Translational GTPase TypA [Candidatus Hepatincolaceae symbiont of Richtersius coronifer]